MDKGAKQINRITLKFTRADIEESFKKYYVDKYFWQLRLAMLISLVIYCLFIISERLLFNQTNTYILLKASIIIPSFLAGYILSFTHTTFYKNQYQNINTFYVLITSLSFIASTIFVPILHAYTFIIGIIICLIFNFTFIRQSFIYASVTGAITLIFSLATIIIYKNIEEYYMFIVFLSLVLFLGMNICYITELDARKSFILLMQTQKDKEKLSDINAFLEKKIKERTKEILDANKILEESKTRLTDASKLAGLGYWIWDIASGEVQWSNEVYHIFDLDKETFVPQIDSIMKLSPWQEDNNRNKELIAKASENKEKGEYEQKFLRPDGSIGYYRSTFKGEYDKEGKLTTIKGTVIDITTIKKYEASLIEKNTELEKYKSKLEQLVEERTRELHDALQKTKELNEELQTANEEFKCVNEELYIKNDIISDKNKELTKAFKNLKNAQEQLIQAEKMASLGILTAGVAHEINNPLNYIMSAYVGLDEYFNDYKSNDEIKTSLFLSSIKEGIERTSAIVKGLSQFSQSHNENDEDCDIHVVVDNCLIILHNKLKHRIELTKEYSDEPLIIKGNIGKLHQVFINVLTNALYAIENKGAIRITTKKDNKNIIITIADNGCGIATEHIKQITDPFFTTKPPGEGTGLGLSISHSIIKEHKGTLEFESEAGKGTNVIITFLH